MAIAFDVKSTQTQNNTATTSSATFTIASVANRLLLVGIAYQATTDDVTSVTWNTSETMTRLLTFTANGERIYIYGLLNPTATTASVTVNKTGASTFVTFWAANYNGVSQSGLPDSVNSATGNSTSPSVSTTTVADNAWLFSCLRGFGSGIAAGTNTTQRSTGSANACDIGDSNSAQTPAGSKSQNWTMGSAAWGLGTVSFAPLASTAFTKTMADSIMNGASRTASVSRVGVFARTVSASIMNAVSRFATVGKGLVRSMTDSIMNSASRFATVGQVRGFVRAVSASIMNSVSRLTTLGGTKSVMRTMTDSIMNSASRLATLQGAKVYIRIMADSFMNARGRLANVKAYIDGLLIQFRSKYTPQGTTYGDKYQKQNTVYEDKYH